MYYESQNVDGNAELPESWEESTFKYCNFRVLDLEGKAFEGVLVGCEVEDCQFYWGLFNNTTFVNVRFKRCIFRGSSFAGCTFTECDFEDCQFIRDSLDGECRFSDCRWYACK